MTQCSAITLYFISVLTNVHPEDQQLSKDNFCYC